MEENKKTNTAIVRFSSGRGNQMEIKFPKVKSSKTCFCNRNFSVSELKEIIKALRERTPYTKNLNLYEFTGDNLFSKAKEGDNILGEEYCDYNLFTYLIKLKEEKMTLKEEVYYMCLMIIIIYIIMTIFMRKHIVNLIKKSIK